MIILPEVVKRLSNSSCVIFLGKPLIYKFAPLIPSLLGLAKETWVERTGGIEYQEAEAMLLYHG